MELNGCGTTAAIPFFIIAIFLINFVFLSVFISVIISSYNDANEKSIRPEDFQQFATHWAEYDPDADCFMPVANLRQFTATLFSPFGFENASHSTRQYERRVGKIKLCKSHEDGNGIQVHFSDVILALSVAHFERKARWNKEIQFDLKEDIYSQEEETKGDVSREIKEMEVQNQNTIDSQKIVEEGDDVIVTAVADTDLGLESSLKTEGGSNGSVRTSGSYQESKRIADEKVRARQDSSRKTIMQRASEIGRNSIDFGNRRKREELADMRLSKYLLDSKGEPYMMAQLLAVQHIVTAWHHYKIRRNSNLPRKNTRLSDMVPA